MEAQLGTVALAFNPSAPEGEEGRTLSSRSAWSAIASSKGARPTQRNPALKSQNQQTNQPHKTQLSP